MRPDRPAAGSSSLLALLAPLPALAVGVLVMRASGVPAMLWGQNVAAWVVGALLCAGLWRVRPSHGPGVLYAAGVLAACGLAATLLDPGMQGVHRWVQLGPVRLHAGAILLPLLLAAVAGLERAGKRGASAVLATVVALVLFAQPDAAQTTAFAAAASVLLLPRTAGEARLSIRLVPLLALAGASWLRSDPLLEVPHVEGIVGLAAELGTGWGAAALASLLLLPVPFLAARREAGDRLALALGAYLSVTLLAAAVGSFPVPVLGYGASPILGYLAAVGLLQRRRGGSAG